ncbi:MAG: hypothetical protein WA610_03675 [Thermodesulfovibrionales bacterium]
MKKSKEINIRHLDEFVKRLLVFSAAADITCELMWNTNLEFSIMCSDIFSWGCSDAERITEETLPELEKAVRDAGSEFGPLLYCARQRKCRPLRAFYEHINKDLWPLFDACGASHDTENRDPVGVWGSAVLRDTMEQAAG